MQNAKEAGKKFAQNLKSKIPKEGGGGGGKAPPPGGSGGGGGPKVPQLPGGNQLKLVAGVIGLGGVLGGIGYAGMHSLYTVEPGHRSIMFNRITGVGSDIYTEGMHFMVPWFDKPIIFDIRQTPKAVQSLTGSKDMQMVNISIRMLIKPDIPNLPYIFSNIGKDYDEKVLPSIVNEITKAVVARYNASELLTKRELVSREIADALITRAADFKIVMEDVAITHLTFSREYTNAIESKKVAQQDAERSRYVVKRAIQEKKSIIIKAEGEAEAAKLVGEAIKNDPGFVELRKIDTAREIASTVANSGQKLYLGSDALMLNLIGDATAKENFNSRGKGMFSWLKFW